MWITCMNVNIYINIGLWSFEVTRVWAVKMDMLKSVCEVWGAGRVLNTLVWVGRLIKEKGKYSKKVKLDYKRVKIIFIQEWLWMTNKIKI